MYELIWYGLAAGSICFLLAIIEMTINAIRYFKRRKK